MLIVDHKNAHESKLGYWRFEAEASTLGLRPGEFPNRLPTTLGNGQPFYLSTLKSNVAIYKQNLGCVVLYVFND